VLVCAGVITILGRIIRLPAEAKPDAAMPDAIGITSDRTNIGEVAERLRIGGIARAEERVAGKLQILGPLQRIPVAPGMKMNVCWNPAIWVGGGADGAKLETAALVGLGPTVEPGTPVAIVVIFARCVRLVSINDNANGRRHAIGRQRLATDHEPFAGLRWRRNDAARADAVGRCRCWRRAHLGS